MSDILVKIVYDKAKKVVAIAFSDYFYKSAKDADVMNAIKNVTLEFVSSLIGVKRIFGMITLDNDDNVQLITTEHLNLMEKSKKQKLLDDLKKLMDKLSKDETGFTLH
jgi:hypothetical protein